MRFLIADDHSIVRLGVKLMLEAGYREVLIDEAENGNETIEKIKQFKYDLLILDFQMPDTDTFNVISNLLARDQYLKILIYSMIPEKIYSDKLLKAGVKGFLSKESKNTELLKAVEVILNGKKYGGGLHSGSNEEGIVSASNPFDLLSNKEMDIFSFLVQGKTTKEISNILNLQVSTISTHKFRIFQKLNVTNTVELLELAKEYHLIRM